METQLTKNIYICKLVYFTLILRNNVDGAGLCCNVYIFLTHNYLCCDSLFSHKVFARRYSILPPQVTQAHCVRHVGIKI